jgi:hypothetical protein
LEKGMGLIEKLSDVEGIIIYEMLIPDYPPRPPVECRHFSRRNIKDSPEGIESDVIMSGS